MPAQGSWQSLAKRQFLFNPYPPMTGNEVDVMADCAREGLKNSNPHAQAEL
jgi:hypothetical protein